MTLFEINDSSPFGTEHQSEVLLASFGLGESVLHFVAVMPWRLTSDDGLDRPIEERLDKLLFLRELLIIRDMLEAAASAATEMGTGGLNWLTLTNNLNFHREETILEHQNRSKKKVRVHGVFPLVRGAGWARFEGS